MKKHYCPCCRHKTLSKVPPRSYAICPVCHWEDDPVQFSAPDCAGGAANDLSPNQARKYFFAFGASAEEWRQGVRAPRKGE